jgi:putative transposase
MNRLQRWVYSYSLDRLECFYEVNGVRVHRIHPAYTSQTWSECGNRDKQSRNGETFCCTAFGVIMDADFNASRNILSRFLEQELIVPALRGFL